MLSSWSLKWYPNQGVKFSTYAFTKVRGAIIDYVRKQDCFMVSSS